MNVPTWGFEEQAFIVIRRLAMININFFIIVGFVKWLIISVLD